MGAQLDTSGVVERTAPGWLCSIATRWPDLSPFVQGYVEAMATSPLELSAKVARAYTNAEPQYLTHFSDLAPETLARIIEDCEEAQKLPCDPPFIGSSYGSRGYGGKLFWKHRQEDAFSKFATPKPEWAARFPPLTVILGDDGEVRFQ